MANEAHVLRSLADEASMRQLFSVESGSGRALRRQEVNRAEWAGHIVKLDAR